MQQRAVKHAKNSWVSSAQIPLLRELLQRIPALSQALSILPPIRLVIDSNIILGEIRWLVKNRRNPTAKTSLRETIESGVVQAYAPEQLRHEIAKYIPILAAEDRIPEDRLWTEWQQYEKILHFCDTDKSYGDERCRAIDPKDVPFLCVYLEIGASAVITKDPHISRMGALSSGIDVIFQLRNYARSKAAEVTIIIGGVVVASVTVGMAIAGIQLADRSARAFSQFPAWLQFLLIIGAAILILHPKSRHKLLAALSSASAYVRSGAQEVSPILCELAHTFEVEHQKAASALDQVMKSIPLRRRVPLRVVVYSVCLAAKGPLSLGEIERAVILGGYRSKARRFRRYLRQVLNRDGRFRCSREGFWALSGT
jgi:predicted nucleic acid-binding protein